ncbi:Tn7-like element transposition protein TnsE, partial [Shigella flexneri]|uniref:Tn7-like element transposition protein TnsE n=1 Tax=Shigella flexneri TaxID=623 RepID=UPI00209664A4
KEEKKRGRKGDGVKGNGSENGKKEEEEKDGEKKKKKKELRGEDSETWRNDFEKIRRGVVKSSLNWPNSLFDQLYGQDGHRGVNHPKGLGELQVSREDMEGWAERVVREQFTH